MATAPDIVQAPARGRVDVLHTALGPLRWYVTFTRKKPLGGIGLALIFLLAIVAIFGPWLAPQDELKIHSRNIFQKPQWSHGFILGADHLGRDVLSRLIIGARVSLKISAVAVALGASIGFFLGLISGYYSGWVDSLIQRVVDTIMSFPSIVLALAIVSVLGRKDINIIWAIGIVGVPNTTRITRSVVLAVRNAEYVQAARALGARDIRILWRHIAPQTFAPVIVLVTAGLGLAILTESSLSFLGLGTAPPKPSWGSMLSGPTLANVERAPWNAVWPGVALSLTVFSFNLVGDALRDVLDPRLRR